MHSIVKAKLTTCKDFKILGFGMKCQIATKMHYKPPQLNLISPSECTSMMFVSIHCWRWRKDHFTCLKKTHAVVWIFEIFYQYHPKVKHPRRFASSTEAGTEHAVRRLTGVLPSGSRRGFPSGRWGGQTPCGGSRTRPGCCCPPRPSPSCGQRHWRTEQTGKGMSFNSGSLTK